MRPQTPRDHPVYQKFAGKQNFLQGVAVLLPLSMIFRGLSPERNFLSYTLCSSEDK